MMQSIDDFEPIIEESKRKNGMSIIPEDDESNCHSPKAGGKKSAIDSMKKQSNISIDAKVKEKATIST